MSDLMTSTALSATAAPDPDAIRAELIGGRLTIAQIADAFDVTERAVYTAISVHSIPYVKAFGVRYLRPEDVRRAILAEANSAPRRPGRPGSKRAA